MREIPDHATFREKEHKLGWLDKLGVFLSLVLCNFVILNIIIYLEHENKSLKHWLFLSMNPLGLHVFNISKNYI